MKKLGHGLKLRSTESSSNTAKAAEIFDYFPRFEDLFTRLETVLMAEFKGNMPLATTNQRWQQTNNLQILFANIIKTTNQTNQIWGSENSKQIK
jgi:hypothetical protein